MKWFLRLFTTLCLIFLGGLGYLHARAAKHAVHHVPEVVLPAKAHLTSFGATQNVHAFRANAAATHKCKIRGILNDNDDDEDDDQSVAVAKYVSAANFLPVFSCTGNSECISSRISKRLPFREHYCYTSSSRYRLFRVFRI